MKKWLKILLIVLAVFVVLVAAAAVYGYYKYGDIVMEVKEKIVETNDLKAQADELNALANDPEFKQNFDELAKGDCSKLEAVEVHILEMETKMKEICSNELFASNPDSAEACADVNAPESQMDIVLAQLKAACDAQAGAQ